MKKELTPEQMEKRIRTNKKIFKFFGIFILGFILLIALTPTPVSPKETAMNELFSKNKFLGTITNHTEKDGIYFIDTDKVKYALTFKDDKVDVLSIQAEEEISFPLDMQDNEIKEDYFNLATKEMIPNLVNQSKLTKKIESQFSAWDGSHINLVKAVKKNLNDPDSFKHEETKYKYDEKTKTILLGMTFRAKNAFNALVLNTAIATADLEGNILSLDIQ